VIPPEAYPGDLFLSVVGLDTYNAPVPEWGGWRWFADIIGGNYDAIRVIAPEMPLWLCETACSEDGGNKADWIRFGPSREILDQWFPRVAAVIWFDSYKTFDWRIDSSPEALIAFREVVHSL
jgi:beta-mannanase